MFERPWGKYEILLQESGIQVKRVELNANSRLSLQKHLKRSEKWIVTSGKGIVTLGSRELPVSAGSYVDIPAGEIHRISSANGAPLVFIEVQLGEYLGEDDIQRFEDDYGRS